MWNLFSKSEGQEIESLVPRFPGILEKAVEDWGKYKLGVKAGLFSEAQRKAILDWFADFPRLWETIKPNFDPWTEGGTIDVEKQPLYEQAERFVLKLRGAIGSRGQLGIAPLIVAGVLIAGAFGVTGAVWAVGYMRKQGNISRMIDGVTAGNLPVDVLTQAVSEEKASVFGDIGGMFKWAVVAGALVVGWPLISKLLTGRGKP